MMEMIEQMTAEDLLSALFVLFLIYVLVYTNGYIDGKKIGKLEGAVEEMRRVKKVRTETSLNYDPKKVADDVMKGIQRTAKRGTKAL